MFEAVELGHKVNKADYAATLDQLRVGLINAQYDLQSANFPLVVLLMGDDRDACNAIINQMGEWMDSRYIHYHFFGHPTEEEKERPRFWRYWCRLPWHGRTGVFMGAWALNAIAARLRCDIDDGEFQQRCEHIRQFEQTLTDDGALILKFWFHLPKSDHKKRSKKGKKQAQIAWRTDDEEWQGHNNYDDFIQLAERYIRITSTGAAPWHLIESAQGRHRNLTVAKTLHNALKTRLGATVSTGAQLVVAGSLFPVDGDHTVLDTVDLTAAYPWQQYREILDQYQTELSELSRKARKQGLTCVLVFEGWDAAGKGGVIRRLTQAMDAQDYRVIPIAAPTPAELAHHYLWRFWTRLPRAGRTVIFDRSWYGRVLVERVEGFAQEYEWQRAYSEINDFESQLAEQGYLVQKFWLHIDPDEQLRRFKARENTPYKKYKITEEDYRNRDRWPDYANAVTDMVTRTSTEFARWHLVPANDKRYARIQVIETFCNALKQRL